MEGKLWGRFAAQRGKSPSREGVNSYSIFGRQDQEITVFGSFVDEVMFGQFVVSAKKGKAPNHRGFVVLNCAISQSLPHTLRHHCLACGEWGLCSVCFGPANAHATTPNSGTNTINTIHKSLLLDLPWALRTRLIAHSSTSKSTAASTIQIVSICITHLLIVTQLGARGRSGFILLGIF